MIYRLAIFTLCFWFLFAVLGLLLPIDPHKIELGYILAPPDLQHWLGCDDLGRSILARLMEGMLTSLSIAIIVISVAFIIGTFLGVVATWLGGIYEQALVMLIDLFMAFPGILLAIALAGLLGPGIINVFIALLMVSWVGFARLARAQVLALKQREHILAAYALGLPRYRLLLRHVLPLVMAPLIVEATFSFAGIIIAEASLSFLGLGVQVPTASLGSMIRQGVNYMLVAPHVVFIPCVAISSVVLSINLIGDYLRDCLAIHEHDDHANHVNLN